MDRKAYPSDVSASEWELMAPYIPDAEPGGRRRVADMREVLNAIFYVLKSGIQWDMLPHDFPPKGTVYHYYNTWRKEGTGQGLNAALRGELRQEMGRNAMPSAGIADSQSVNTSVKGGDADTMQASP